MKSSTKKKEEVKQSKKSLTKTKAEEKTLSEEDKNVLNLWEEEVRAVLDNKFNTFEEAVNAIINGVVARMEPDKNVREKTRDFLFEFMTSDESVVNEIKAIFNL